MKLTPITKVVTGSVLALSSFASVALAHSAGATSPTCDPSLLKNYKGSAINISFEESMTGNGLTSGPGNKGRIKAMVDAYNASQSKVHVTDINDTGGYTDTWTKYVASLGSGSAVGNVVQLDQYDATAANDSQGIVPISTCLAADKAVSTKAFVPKALTAYTIGKSLVGMPFSVSTPVMYYNQKALTKAGIKTPPTTWDQLIADQTKLKAKGYKYGVAIKKDPWLLMTLMGMEDTNFVNNGNGHTSYATAASFSNATAATYWGKIQTIIKNGGYATSASGSISTAYANLFAIGSDDAAITIDTTAALGTIYDALGLYPNVSLGVAPVPTLTGKVKGSTPPGGNGLFITKASSSLQTAAAWDFIKYMTSAASIANWAAGTGYIPIRTDSLTAWKNTLGKKSNATLWYSVAYNAFTKGKSDTATAGPAFGAYQAVSDDITTALNTLTTNTSSSPASLLASAQAAATADIAAYNSRVH